MTSYHCTDSLGGALVTLRGDLRRAGDVFDQLEAEVNAEREAHQAETRCLVERAELAERELAGAESEVRDLRGQVDDLAEQVEQAEQAAQDWESRADDTQAQLDDRETRVSDLEDQVVGYQQSLGERNAELEELKARHAGANSALEAERHRISDLTDQLDLVREMVRRYGANIDQDHLRSLLGLR